MIKANISSLAGDYVVHMDPFIYTNTCNWADIMKF